MTDDVLQTLIAVAGVPPEPVEPMPAQDLEAIFGTPLPADYLRYVQVVPDGFFRGCLQVLQPQWPLAALMLGTSVGHHRDALRAAGAPGHLLPCAAIGDDYIVCWVTGGDPDTWRIDVFDRWTLHPFDGGLTDFLLAFVTGGTGIAALDFAYRHDTDARFVLDAPPRLPPARVDPLGWTGREPLDARPALPDASAPAGVDWAAVAARLGTGLPADYRRLVDAGGAGRIRYVRLAAPGGELDLFDLITQTHSRMLTAMDTRGGLRAPYHPEAGGLIPFATCDNGSTMCWIPLGTDPERWPVTVVDRTFTTMTDHRMTATELLAEVRRTEPLDERGADAVAAAFLLQDYRQWLAPDEEMPVRTAPEWAFTDGRLLIVPFNSKQLLDDGDTEGELAGNNPIVVDLDTHECRFLDFDEILQYRRRGFGL